MCEGCRLGFVGGVCVYGGKVMGRVKDVLIRSGEMGKVGCGVDEECIYRVMWRRTILGGDRGIVSEVVLGCYRDLGVARGHIRSLREYYGDYVMSDDLGVLPDCFTCKLGGGKVLFFFWVEDDVLYVGGGGDKVLYDRGKVDMSRYV